MTTHLRLLGNLASFALAFLLVLSLPARAASQEPVRDTTGPGAPVKDLPLTAAQRQAFVGSYLVTLPWGKQDRVRIFEEKGVLKVKGEDENEIELPRLLYQGDAVFRPEGKPGFVLTFVLEGGRATRFTGLRPDGGVMEGVRVR